MPSFSRTQGTYSPFRNAGTSPYTCRARVPSREALPEDPRVELYEPQLRISGERHQARQGSSNQGAATMSQFARAIAETLKSSGHNDGAQSETPINEAPAARDPNGFRWAWDVDWSPASNFLAILTILENGRRAIWTVRPDGSQQREVIEEDELASPRWSPAGDGIYFLHTSQGRQGQTQDLLKVAIDPKSGQAKEPASVLLSGLQIGGYFTVSADGTRLAYSRSQRYSNLWLAQFQGPNNGRELGQGLQTMPLTRGTSKVDSPAISPNGKWIAFVTEGHIYKMPMEGGTPIQLTFSNAADISPAWSPDGERIAFGSDEGGSPKVWTVDADGANRRQFAKTQLGGGITWSPGHDILYEKMGNRNIHILDPETAEEKPLVQNESAGRLFTPKYSPDGKKVAVFWNRRSQRDRKS